VKRTPLKRSSTYSPRRSPIRYKPRAESDKVTPQLHQFILARDGQCMAPVLDINLASLCADQFGNTLQQGSYFALQRLQLDHVSTKGHTAMGKRAPSDMRHLVALCPYHHIPSGWATSHRPLLRDYLESLYGDSGEPG